ncbi:cobalamin-binding protein [Polynucleobacter sp. MWH-CaK5]|uniref:cobalamin-binding protein n=1 Tax=Polynucleobacter sp. MWH-CaK5 TaxID=2689107 RepID=UPI001BFE2E02|nr:cobalamin-binding protein [Polynucleobacter sp. MWH-CaK5]QWD89293.1 cobalamin-binding protein [Polynucleobacter sp. MWH-CaK5]
MRSQGFSIALIASQLLFGISISFSSHDSFAKQEGSQPKPQRIITLAPHLSELVDSAGGSERLVGVSAYSNHPTSVKQLPITSDARSIDLEKMKSLRPDLIIYWRGGMSESQIQSIKKTFNKDVQFIAVEPKKLLDIATDIETIGKALGTDLIAKKNADVLRLKITELKNTENKQTNISQRKVRVFYQVWAQPLMTLNKDHIISDIIQLCGGEQLFANEKVLVPTVSREAVIKANPEIIFTAVDNQKMSSDWSMWTSFSQLAATKNKAFVDLDGDIISRPSPRIMQGAQKICAEINRLR